ncbi:sugar phosphate isomerase/epimerase family protein [Paenibacillus sepulcri]|uniref:Sugar phosphate isomerase/epimerase n=1 Tax=Paenibacillus sepulcri TaxID=359917 RepID=A0ABS7BX95_9BACL|nr:sugar phosphate isomerase/epimerase [Paenibacillus sepulcri]
MNNQIGIGLQMYTLREELNRDFRGTLRKVAEIGYEGVEFAGYGQLEAGELKSLLDELKLKAIGSHVSLPSIRSRLAEEVAFVKAIGGQYMICPSIPMEMRHSAAPWKNLFSELEEAGRLVREAGLTFGYHNHAFEFEFEVEGRFVFDALLGTTSPEHVVAEMDACWVHVGGQDPIAYLHQYGGRIPLIHLKDYGPVEAGGKDTVELGKGEQDLHAIIQAASAADVQWLIVEQDRCQNAPLQSVSDSYSWLRQVLGE